jgi:tRNA dimethylallyltransferase
MKIEQPPQLKKIISDHLMESQEQKKIPLIAVIGPTASGKTALGIALAQAFNGEIISADSRQIYQEMDIGSGIPTHSELSTVKHHLINYLKPNEIFTLSDFQKVSEQLINQIHQTGKLPILVGGTGLYINAITQNYQLPESEPNQVLRQKYQEIADREGNSAVYKVLQTLDPKAALAIHPNNLRYVIRAIEIASQTDLPRSNKRGNSPYLTLYLQIDWPRAELYQRIESRIEQQIAAGLVAETEALLQKYGRDLPALTSLGYQEIGDYLQGEISLEKAVELFKKNTRNFAKRQLTWFRKIPQVYSVSGENLQQIIANISST